MLRLTHLEIRKWQDAAPASLRFDDDAVLLLGLNGSGKSTLLQLLCSLAAVDLRWAEDHAGAIDLSWTLTLDGPGPLAMTHWTLNLGPAALGARRWQPREGSLSCDLESEGAIHRIRFTSDGMVDVDGERRETERSFTAVLHTPTAYVTVYAFSADPPKAWEAIERAVHLATGAPMDEALEAFNSIVDGHGRWKVDAGYVDVSSMPVLGVIPGEFALSIIDDADVEGFRERTGVDDTKFAEALRELHRPRPGNVVDRMAGGIGASSVAVRPRLGRRLSHGPVEVDGFDMRVAWPDGAEVPASALSFGQKRMLAFHWYHSYIVMAPLFFDELTNGLHSRWVDECIAAMAGQQSFHAVQNPLLVDRLGPGTSEEFERRFVLCELELVEGRRRWRWRNPTSAEAAELRRVYDGGLQLLSEVLQDNGLW